MTTESTYHLIDKDDEVVFYIPYDKDLTNVYTKDFFALHSQDADVAIVAFHNNEYVATGGDGIEIFSPYQLFYNRAKYIDDKLKETFNQVPTKESSYNLFSALINNAKNLFSPKKESTREEDEGEEPITKEEQPATIITEPTIEEPTIEEHITEEPIIEEQSIIEEPIIEEQPITEELITEEEPTIEDSMKPITIITEPMIEEPTIEDSMKPITIITEPMIEEPTIEDSMKPITEEPIIEEEPTIEDSMNPITEEPIIEEEPITEEEPTIEDSMKPITIITEPMIEEPTIEDSTIEEEPIIEEPIIEDSATGEPIIEPNVEENVSALSQGYIFQITIQKKPILKTETKPTLKIPLDVMLEKEIDYFKEHAPSRPITQKYARYGIYMLA